MPGPDETVPEPAKADPEALMKALEMELVLKRGSWQKARAQRGARLALSFLFLLLVIVGSFLAYFYFAREADRRGDKSTPREAVDSSR